MRVSPKLAVAIWGRPCTGKSTVAKILAEKYDAPVRHCGDVTKRVAAYLNLDITDLTDDCHRMIDAETADWVRAAREWCVVEGRYLDQVLGSAASVVELVHFVASAETRAARWGQKAGQSCSVADIERVGIDDDAFRRRMYESFINLQPTLTVDTTCSTPEEIADFLGRRTHATKDGHD